MPTTPVSRLVTSLLVAALLATACGSGLTREEIVAAQGSGGGLGAAQGGVAAAGGTAAGGTVAGGASAPAAGGAVAGGTGAGTGGAGAAAGGTVAPETKLTASDVGVTRTTITIGNVSALSGPLPPYPVPVHAIETYFREVNAAGGILGRKLVLKVIDDGLDPGRNAAAHRALADEVFMFLGSLTLADAGGAQIIRQHGIPDIGFALSPQRAYLPTHARMGAQAGLSRGGKSVVQALYGKRIGVKRMAVLPLDADAAEIDADAFQKTLEAVGIEVCLRESQPLVQPDYTALIARMRAEECDGFYAIFDLNSAAKLQRDIFRQGWQPKYALYPLTIYEKRFVELAGGPQAAEGAHLYFDQLPLDEPNPTMRTLVSTLAKYYPNDDPANYGVVPNWADTLLFIEALKRAGPNPTRARFLEELGKIRDFDAGGIYPPWRVSPLAKVAQPCWLVMVFKSGRWQRANAATGFECGRVVK